MSLINRLAWPILAAVPLIYLNISMPEHLDLWPFQVLNFVFGLFCILRIFPIRAKYRITTNAVTYMFVYVFFVVAPLYQYKEQVSFWTGRHLTNEQYVLTTAILFAGIVVYDIFYKWFYVKSKPAKKNRLIKEVHRNWIYPLILCVCSTCMTLFAYRHSPELLFFRKLEGAEISTEFSNTSVNLLFSMVIRPMPIILTTFYLLICRRFDICLGMLAIMTLITNFPLSLPRFYVAGVYIPLIFALWKSLINKPLTFRLILLFGILYVFPFLNQGRTVDNADEIEFSLAPNYDMFLHGHFDAFQNGARVIMNDLVTYGNQLLGCIFFWVPRSMWPNKPIGSGGFIAERFHMWFDHISVNYWAEGWINFGIVGLLLFSVILAYINARCDYTFWQKKHNLLFSYCFLLYIGMIIFILRGDMISSVAFVVGFLSSACICYHACVKIITLKVNKYETDI